MGTKALDLVTMGRALNELSETYLGDCQWRPINQLQQEFLAWYTTHRQTLNQLSGLDELASPDYLALNGFLVRRGFEPQFEPIEGIGVVSILDMLVKWIAKGELTTISRNEPSSDEYGKRVTYPAFRIMPGGVDIYDVAGFSQPLVRLPTATGHSFWLMKVDEPASGLELALTAQKILIEDRTVSTQWTVGTKVPMLEIEIEPDLSWILGLNTDSPLDEFHRIAQAFQQFRLRANEQGAHVKVATGFGTVRGFSSAPVPYTFDQPFIGFFSQPGSDTLPMAAFWADTDSWRNPEGTLEEL